MRRDSHANRLNEIASAALSAFSDRGFRLTQVADIAKLAGVAPGTIYLFAKSKEDLFWLALRLAMDKPLAVAECRPLGADELRAEFALEKNGLNLRARIDAGDLPTLDRVVSEHWDVVSRAARAINLIERCARDWPELAEVFYSDLRAKVVCDLTDYLIAGADAGLCRHVPNPAMAARLIIETIAWFAMHRLGDADGRHFDPVAAKAATLDALIHAYGAAHGIQG